MSEPTETGALPIKPIAVKIPVNFTAGRQLSFVKPNAKRAREESSSSSSSSSNDSSSSEEDSSSDEQDSSSRSSSMESVEPSEPTLFDLANKKGLINEEALFEDDDDVPVNVPPPRPPRFVSFPSNLDNAIARQKEKLNREENLIQMRDDNKSVSLGTSKVNYIDPRIICSWAKAHDVPIKRIFSATLQKKFPWAMGSENFEF